VLKNFFQTILNSINVEIKLTFIFKIPFEILNLQSKVMDKFQRGIERDIFLDIFKHPLWILSINFFWRLKITSGFMGMKIGLISQLYLNQSFLKKTILLCQNEVWNFTLNTILTFGQWVVKLSSSNYPISFEGSWRTIDFISKTTSPTFILSKCQWRNLFSLPLKKSHDGRRSLEWTLDFLTNIENFLFFTTTWSFYSCWIWYKFFFYKFDILKNNYFCPTATVYLVIDQLLWR